MSNLGIPIQILDGVEHKSTMFSNVESRIIFDLKNNPKYHSDVIDLMVSNELEGMLDGVEYLGSTQEQDQQVLKYLIKTRDLIIEDPDRVKHIQNPVQMAQMFEYAIKYWNTDKRDEALTKLAEMEADLIDAGNIRIDFLQGINDQPEEWCIDADGAPELKSCNYSYSEVEGLNGESVMVKHYQFNGLSGFWSKVTKGVTKAWNKTKKLVKKVGSGIKNTTKKVGSGIKNVSKKIWNGVKKYNPLSIAVRNGFLLALRTNVFHMSDKLAVGYLSEKQAYQYGVGKSDWQKAVEKLHKVEKLHVNTLGGKSDSLKKAILSGKRKELRSLSGIDDVELGIVATATGTAAASGVIAKVLMWIKELKPFSWFKKNPRKAELQDKYGRKEGREKYREEKRILRKEHGGSVNNLFNRQEHSNYNSNISPVGYNTPPSFIPVNTPPPNKPKFLSKEWRVQHKKGLIIGGVVFTVLLFGGAIAVNERKKKKRKKKAPKQIGSKANAVNGITKVEIK